MDWLLILAALILVGIFIFLLEWRKRMRRDYLKDHGDGADVRSGMATARHPWIDLLHTLTSPGSNPTKAFFTENWRQLLILLILVVALGVVLSLR